MPKQKILLALFDVRPKDASGNVDVEKLEQLPKILDLRASYDRPPNNPIIQPTDDAVSRPQPEFSGPSVSLTEQLIGETPLANGKDIVTKEIEEALNHESPLVVDLVWVGAKLHEPRQQRLARPRLIKKFSRQIIEEKPVPEIAQPVHAPEPKSHREL